MESRALRTAEAIGGGNIGDGLDGRTVDPELAAAARLTDPSFYAGNPHPVYARLRAEAPVSWCEDGQVLGTVEVRGRAPRRA